MSVPIPGTMFTTVVLGNCVEGRNLDIDANDGDPYVELHLAGPGLKGDDTFKQACASRVPFAVIASWKWPEPLEPNIHI
eukprot:9485480-Pyramimonas_sp.AAC.2